MLAEWRVRLAEYAERIHRLAGRPESVRLQSVVRLRRRCRHIEHVLRLLVTSPDQADHLRTDLRLAELERALEELERAPAA
jgi:hypothetical protein